MDNQNLNQTEGVSNNPGDTVKTAGEPVYIRLALPISILVAALLISGSILFVFLGRNGNSSSIRDGSEPPAKVADIQVTENDIVLGSQDAKVTLVEFSDYQCPFCRSFWANSLPTIKKDYIDTGKVRFVYKDFPLDFHPGAKPYAQAARCAGDQGKYWQMHDKIFSEQEKQGQGTIQYDGQSIGRWAGEIGLNLSDFNQCFSSNKYTERIDQDSRYGTSLATGGTPTFFINGIRMVGAQPLGNFLAVIEEQLNK